MDNEHEPQLEDAERLRRGPIPPATLESRVVEALRQEGLIRTSRVLWWLGRVAASLLVFALGTATGHYLLPDLSHPQPASAQPRYLLLLAGDVTPASDGSTRAAEYGNWARNIRARGISISGDELTTHAETVSNQQGTTFPNLTSMGGYFVIEAPDDASAARLARTCPHIKYGGSIVVRRLQ